MRKPWEHLILAGIGGWVGYHYVAYETQLLERTNILRASRGLPPLTNKGQLIMSRPTVMPATAELQRKIAAVEVREMSDLSGGGDE